MGDSASSSSSTASSKCSSDTEMMVKPKRAKVPKHGKVRERHKHKMKLRSSKRKHYHKKQQSKLHSSTDRAHRHKISGRKRKAPQKRKRKPSHSPSSDTSSASEEDSDVSLDTDSLSSDESSSEQECTSRKVPKHSKPSAKHKRKKAKLSVKSSQTSARNRQLRAVFKDHFAELMLLVSDPEQLAAQLYTKSLISPATLEKIITLPASRQQRNLHLLLDLDRTIQADTEKLFAFIDVIQKDPSLEKVGERMSGMSIFVILMVHCRALMFGLPQSVAFSCLCFKQGLTTCMYMMSLSAGEATEPTLEEEHKQSSTVSNHTSTTEEKNKGEVITLPTSLSEGSISTKQEKHQSLEDVDYTSVPRQLPSFSSAIAKYQHYLKSVYEARPTPMDDKLFINPCAQYINLAIIKKEELSHEEADEFTRATLHGGIDQIFQKKKKVQLKDIFVTEDGCESPLKCILVEGPPGIGKSTFAWELCRKWDALEVMQKYILVVLFKLREKRVQNAKHLFELFSHPSDPTLSQAVVGEILEGEHVLLILDGFDEFPASLLDEDNCLVRQIIGGSCLPKAAVVVTSRPSAKASFATCQCKISKHIEIIGFTEEDRVKYAQSAFTSQPDMLVHFLKYSFSNPTIKAMMYIPLNCAIVTQIYKNCMCGGSGKKLIPRTMTQLYTALCHSLLRRYLVENSLVNRDYRMPQELNDLPQDVCKQLHTLSKIAFDGIEQQKLVFYKHELPEGFQHMGFMNECRELYVDKGVESSYNFLHLSLQEYLAAWYVSQLPDIEQKLFFLDKKGGHQLVDVAMVRSFQAGITNPGMSVVKKFLAGITGFRSAVWQDILQPEAGELTVSKLMCTCLYETQNYMLCQQLLSSSVIKTGPYPISLNAHLLTSFYTSVDFYALGYCITHSRGAWMIEAIADSGAEALEMLVNGLKNEPKHHLETGSIHSFAIIADLSVGVAWFKELPQLILFHLSELALISCRLGPKSCELLTQAIPMMPNLHSLDISQNRNIGPGGAVYLLKSLCSLKQLECLKVTETNIGSLDAKVLIKFIAVSNTLQILHVSNPTIILRPSTAKLLGQSTETMTHKRAFPKVWVQDSILKEIIPTALAIGTLKEFEICQVTRADMVKLSSLLPFNSSITTLSLCDVGLDDFAYLTPALYSNESLTSLNITISYHNQGYGNFSKEEVIVLLNDALQHNIHCKHLKLEPCFPCIHDLAYRLRRGPTGPQHKLKRSHSLPCLKFKSTALLGLDEMLSLGHKFGTKMTKEVFDFNPELRRCSSSLDLALTESISSLHPTLTDSLHIGQFYYGHPANDVGGASNRLLQLKH